MKFLLICSIILFQTLYADTSAMVAATLKINQVAEQLSLQQRKVRTCSTRLDELKGKVEKKDAELAELKAQVKDTRAGITEQNGLLGVCDQKLGIAKKIEEQSQEVSFDLAHKNKDNEKILQKKIAELTQTIEELNAEFQNLKLEIGEDKKSRDMENEKGEQLDARVSALNIKMEAVLKALKQAQSDAEAEQLKRIEISAKRLATHIKQWDAEEAKALKLEQELEKLEKVYTRLRSVQVILNTEYHDTKIILNNIGDQIATLDTDISTLFVDTKGEDDEGEPRRQLKGTKKGMKKVDKKEETPAAVEDKPATAVEGDLLPVNDEEPASLLDVAESDDDLIINLLKQEDLEKDSEEEEPQTEEEKESPSHKVITLKSVGEGGIMLSKDDNDNYIFIDVDRDPLNMKNDQYKFVSLNTNPLQKISDKVHFYKQEIGKAVRSLSTCRADVVTENSVLQKLESNIETETKEVTCARDEITEVYKRLEICEIQLQEVQEQILLIDENNKALAAENDAGNGRVESLFASVQDQRETVHKLQIQISMQHNEIQSLNKEIENEKEHEAVVVKMIANIESTISHISAKTAELQGKADCPTLAEQENEQKLVLVKGAFNEANTRVIHAENNILKLNGDIETIEGILTLLWSKINAMRLEINQLNSEQFFQNKPDPKTSDFVNKHLVEEAGVGSEAAPFYKSTWTWLLVLLSFAGGYIAFGYMNKKSADRYQQILANPSEIALSKI